MSPPCLGRRRIRETESGPLVSDTRRAAGSARVLAAPAAAHFVVREREPTMITIRRERADQPARRDGARDGREGQGAYVGGRQGVRLARVHRRVAGCTW